MLLLSYRMTGDYQATALYVEHVDKDGRQLMSIVFDEEDLAAARKTLDEIAAREHS